MPQTQPVDVFDPPHYSTLEMLASEAGVRITSKQTIRFPVIYLAELMRTVERYGLVGRLSVDYSQGKAGSVTWEGGAR